MRSMAVRNSARRRRFAVLAAAFLTVAFVAVQKWDEEALEEMRAEAARAPARAIAYAADLKREAVMYAIEESGHQQPFASDFHCRVPVRGERLSMQHANPRDPGRGFRCVYWLTTQRTDPPLATFTWSRSPELTRTAPMGAK